MESLHEVVGLAGFEGRRSSGIIGRTVDAEDVVIDGIAQLAGDREEGCGWVRRSRAAFHSLDRKTEMNRPTINR